MDAEVVVQVHREFLLLVEGVNLRKASMYKETI